ncbi:MAG: hypothetical protein HC772_04090 [Leptolyngbyaceae cyanobacterium CRU_2_3]|nr:hypothetical protein [Leptolyngbyaceae cyanobacterium CRU_2_3]
MIAHIQSTLEQPNSVFGGLPICPYVQRARLQQLIRFHVYPFDSRCLNPTSDLMKIVREFQSQQRFEVLLIIHSNRNAMSFSQLQMFVTVLDQQLASMQLTAFGGHPDDPFHIQNIRTRQDPYPNIAIQSIQKLKRASDQLSKTHYYDHWSAENLKSVGLPR